MNKENIKYKNIASIISAIMLILAIPKIWPYGYYIFLRWVITSSSIFLAWISYNLKKTFWLFSMVLIALLFNPIASIYLRKEVWVVIDSFVTILFLGSIFRIKPND